MQRRYAADQDDAAGGRWWMEEEEGNDAGRGCRQGEEAVLHSGSLTPSDRGVWSSSSAWRGGAVEATRGWVSAANRRLSRECVLRAACGVVVWCPLLTQEWEKALSARLRPLGQRCTSHADSGGVALAGGGD